MTTETVVSAEPVPPEPGGPPQVPAQTRFKFPTHHELPPCSGIASGGTALVVPSPVHRNLGRPELRQRRGEP